MAVPVRVRGGGAWSRGRHTRLKSPTEIYLLERENPMRFLESSPAITIQDLQVKCCVCRCLSPGDLYECQGGDHVVCNPCYQSFDSKLCPYFIKCGITCAKPIRKSMLLCQYPGCNQLFTEEEAWKKHISKCSCRTEFYVCLDDECKAKSIIPKAMFVTHCEEKHGVLLSTEVPHVFLLKKLTNSAKPGYRRLLSAFESHKEFFYILAECKDSNQVSIFCFMLNQNPAWRNRFSVCLTLEDSNSNVRKQGRQSYMAVSHTDWDLLDNGHILGSNILLTYLELDRIYSCQNLSDEMKKYPITLELNDLLKPSFTGFTPFLEVRGGRHVTYQRI